MDNLYKAPEATLIEPIASNQAGAFFVTSIRKMAILYIATLGMYILYWGYKQWDSQRSSMPKRIRPVWRSIFIVFYMHSLSRRISERFQGQWKSTSAANLFVALVILGAVLGNVTSRENVPVIVDILAMALQLCSLIPMISIQRQANLASQDPEGLSNSTLSGSNIAFIILGGVVWLLYLLGLAMLMIGVTP